MAVIHRGVDGGMTRARSSPVTPAERSFSLTCCLVISLKRASAAIALHVETMMFSNAGSPKITMPNTETGVKAMSMFLISAVEFTGDAMWGLEDKRGVKSRTGALEGGLC
jgi:hypothetical protein